MHCRSWRHDAERVDARCWVASGNEIQLCGHGLLCCAAAWHAAEEPFDYLRMRELRIAHRRDDALFWVGLPSIDCRPCAAPAWLREYFDVMPWRAAMTAEDDGYLILEFAADFDLRELSPPDYGIRRRTQRSLIVTCADESNADIDIQLRYFAPQHGVPEDTATGSAMRVLASYWSNRELSDRLSAYQCSTEGGLLFSEYLGETTWVGGYVDGPNEVSA